MVEHLGWETLEGGCQPVHLSKVPNRVVLSVHLSSSGLRPSSPAALERSGKAVQWSPLFDASLLSHLGICRRMGAQRSCKLSETNFRIGFGEATFTVLADRSSSMHDAQLLSPQSNVHQLVGFAEIAFHNIAQ